MLKREAESPHNGYQGNTVVDGNERLLGAQLTVPRPESPGIMKKSEPRLPNLKQVSKKPVVKSPSVPKRQLSPESGSGKPRTGVTTLQLPEEHLTGHISRSLEDLDTKDDDSGTRENGSGSSDVMDEFDSAVGGGVSEDSEAANKRAAIEHYQLKITKTMEQIKEEQAQKEANVNEYLRVAGEADKQQLVRIKQVFEKKNQKSTQSISQLQKKLEKHHKSLRDIEQFGLHKQTRDKLKDMGQGLKDVGANIVDGITGFSGGVVGNIKGAKEHIVSKPREFAHLIKNKFGSADNITALKASDESQPDEGEKPGGGTLPARLRPLYLNFKYGSDEENSSITSGSGFGAHSSPHSNSQNASQQIMIPPQYEILQQEVKEVKETNASLIDQLKQIKEEFEVYKMQTQEEVGILKMMLYDDKNHTERLEEQINDVTELHQHEVNNIKQDISSMEEKIEYRMDERTSDIQDLLENCQTRVTKMELQQQQQQLISMEMVENVTFRTILTKLINVVLALIAVILVVVSTVANLLAPFLTTRGRILSTAVLVAGFILTWNNFSLLCDFVWNIYSYLRTLLPNR